MFVCIVGEEFYSTSSAFVRSRANHGQAVSFRHNYIHHLSVTIYQIPAI